MQPFRGLTTSGTRNQIQHSHERQISRQLIKIVFRFISAKGGGDCEEYAEECIFKQLVG